jgi:hypothetical protein
LATSSCYTSAEFRKTTCLNIPEDRTRGGWFILSGNLFHLTSRLSGYHSCSALVRLEHESCSPYCITRRISCSWFESFS